MSPNIDVNTYYKDNLVKYTDSVNLAIKISKLAAGRPAPDDKVAWACVLFTKMCVTGFSMLILTPNSNVAEKKVQHWDFSSLFSLTRNLMECYETMFYLCVDVVSPDELKARRKLFNLHDYYARKKMHSFHDSTFENKEIEGLVIKELSETAFFNALEEKQQKRFLKGDEAFFISREDIEEKIGNKKADFKMIYKLFSSNVHSYPMGFYGMLEGNRGTGVKTEVEVGYSAFALEIAQQYISQASKDILVFFLIFQTN